jgi:hypothetical protein
MTGLKAFGWLAGKIGLEGVQGKLYGAADWINNNAILHGESFDPYSLNKEFKANWDVIKEQKANESKNNTNGGNNYYDIKVINPIGTGIEDYVLSGINKAKDKEKNLEYMRMGDTSIMGGGNKDFLDAMMKSSLVKEGY